MRLAREVVMAAMVGCAVNPQHALPPPRLRIPGIPTHMKFTSRTDAVRHFAAMVKGGGKLARKAKRKLAVDHVKQAIANGKRERLA